MRGPHLSCITQQPAKPSEILHAQRHNCERGGMCLTVSSPVPLTLLVLRFTRLISYPQLFLTDCLGISNDGEIRISKLLLSVKSNTRN